MLNSSPNDVVYVLFTHDVGVLEGKMLTYLDAILTDPIQRKAAKDIVRPMIWEWAIQSNMVDLCEVKRTHDNFIFTNKVSVGSNESTGKKK